MIFTPSISGAGTAHSASPAQPANLSLADFLFADASASAASDFRTIAAALFGVESSTAPPTPTPAKGAADSKKPAADLSTGKSDDRKNKAIAEPVSTGTPVALFVPPQSSPLQPPQISTTSDAADTRHLNSGAIHEAVEPGLAELSEVEQIKGTALATVPTPGTSGHIVPLSGFAENDTISTQPSGTEDRKNSGKQAARIELPITHTPVAHNVEPTKSATAPPQPPDAPPTARQSLTPATSTTATSTPATSIHQTPHSSAPTLPGNQEKPPAPAATDVVPVAPPPAPSPDAAAKAVLDSSIRSVSQSGLADPGVVAVPKSVSTREAASVSSKIKNRDSKNSHLTSAPSGKPGFTQPAQVAGAPANSAAGNNKDFAGMPSSPHAGAQAKPAPLKDAGAAPGAAAQADADAPDESVPTTATSEIATAKLVQGTYQSEFRVGMQSQEFGSIDIRTSVARHMFSAQISVEHGDMAKSLTAQLPGLYHRLADQQVAVGNIVIQGQSLATSSGLAQDAQRQSWQPQGHSDSAPKSTEEPILPVITGGIDSAGRLDVRI